VSATGQPNSTFSWIGAGTEFRIENDTSNSTSVLLSGHGSPASVVNGALTSLNYFMARANPPFYLPGVRLVQELNNQLLTIQYIGTTTSHGIAAVQVHVSDDSDTQGSQVTPHEWLFDASTFVPLEVQLRLPANEDPTFYISASLDFWQFQNINGLLVPSQFSLSEGDLGTPSFTSTSVVFNSGVPQSVFDPQGGQ